MDHRFLRITAWVVLTPMAFMTTIALIAMAVVNLPAQGIVFGLVRVSTWLIASAIIGGVIWLFLALSLRSDGVVLRLPALIGTVAMTLLPLCWFIFASDSLFEYLQGATILYWIFLACSPCILCITAPMAWRLYNPDGLGRE